MRADGCALQLLRDQYRHCKTMLAVAAAELLADGSIPASLPTGEAHPGLIAAASESARCARPLGRRRTQHRQFGRETDPPRV